MSQDTKMIIVILLLVFFMPVGIILMWLWMTWPKWVKILITLIPIFFILIWMAFMALIFSVIFTSIKNAPSSSTRTYQYNNEQMVYPSSTPSVTQQY